MPVAALNSKLFSKMHRCKNNYFNSSCTLCVAICFNLVIQNKRLVSSNMAAPCDPAQEVLTLMLTLKALMNV